MEFCEQELMIRGFEKETAKMKRCASNTTTWMRTRSRGLTPTLTGGDDTMRNITILNDEQLTNKQLTMEESESSELLSGKESEPEDDYEDDFDFEY